MVAYLFFAGAVAFVGAPVDSSPTYLNRMLGDRTALIVAIAIVSLAVFLGLGAALLHSFWNRLITDLFRVRALAYKEALASFLMISVVSTAFQ